MKFLKACFHITIIALLTILTQTGGIIYIVALLINPKFSKRVNSKISLLLRFLVLYSFVSFIITPPLAKVFGRVALPVFSNNNVKPLNIMTYLLNRNYVTPQLKKSIESVSEKMNREYPNTVICYLDANFPFYNGYPLLPHLSHNDGKKLDLAFLYKDNTGKEVNKTAPSFIGYGVYEKPKEGESNTSQTCTEKGYWHYSILHKIVPQRNAGKFTFDEKRNRALINIIAKETATDKIFIEPHLKARMGITSNKIKFHGCHSIRHDDHIHFEIH